MRSGYSPSEGFTKLKMANPYVTGIYSLLYPLFAVGAMGITPTQQKEWIMNHIGYLGCILGISLAFAAVAMPKEGKSLGP
jgi:hypothetical protein